MEVVAADLAVGVALEAEQLGVLALVVHGLDPLLGDGGSALGVVGDYLGNGDAGGVDLTVDEEAGDARIVSGLDGLDGGVGAGVVEDDERGLVGDGGLYGLELTGSVVVVGDGLDLVAELLGLGAGDLGLGGEEHVGGGRGDHVDDVAAAAGQEGGLFAAVLGGLRRGGFADGGVIRGVGRGGLGSAAGGEREHHHER